VFDESPTPEQEGFPQLCNLEYFRCFEVFSLAGNVDLLLFCTFLKHNNKISFSLSLSLGFPTLGFSLAFA
jgi:hypothetical protein